MAKSLRFTIFLTVCLSIFFFGCSVSQSDNNQTSKHNIKITDKDGMKLSDDASDFVILSEEIPDVILEIRYYSTYNFVGDRINGYEQPIALITKEAADALKKVSDELIEKGYRLKIYDAYRPQKAVTHFVNWGKDLSDTKMKKYFYPELEKSVLFEQEYIAEHSGHSRGSTVDLTLLAEEWWHFTLADEPFPDVYFTFPVNINSVDTTK